MKANISGINMKYKAPKPKLNGFRGKKTKYLSTQTTLKDENSSRNKHTVAVNSMSDRKEMIKMQSTNGDENDWNLDTDRVEDYDKYSQQSAQIPISHSARGQYLEPRSHSNSINMISESGTTITRVNELLDLSNRSLTMISSHHWSSKLKHIKLSNNLLINFPEQITE